MSVGSNQQSYLDDSDPEDEKAGISEILVTSTSITPLKKTKFKELRFSRSQSVNDLSDHNSNNRSRSKSTSQKKFNDYNAVVRARSTINLAKRPASAYLYLNRRTKTPSFSARRPNTALSLNNKLIIGINKENGGGDDDLDERVSRPKRTFLNLIRLTLVGFGIETLFSMQEALAVPLLLKLKVPESLYSLVFLLSPLVGFFLQPMLGVWSDRCQSRFGRRRPFILVLTLLALFGLVVILNAYELGLFLGDDSRHISIPKIAIILTCIGVTILNFSADSSDSPLRALILDVCNTEDQDTGLNIHAFFCAMGCATGFVLGAVDWTQTFLKFIGDDTEILSVFASVILVSNLIVTLTSVKETPLVLHNHVEKLPLIENRKDITVLPDELNEATNEESTSEEEEDEDEDEERGSSEDDTVTLKMLYKSVLNMPKELFRLLICQIFGWMTIFSSCLFFTDFVAQSIYKGDPSAPTNSTSFELYNDGVKMGCWCLFCYSIVSAISANFFYAICMSILYFQTSIYVIMPLSSSLGIILTANVTLPYQMISEFHNDKVYRSKSAPGTKRGIGNDCALLSSVYFLSQTIVASIMSLLTSSFGNYAIVVVSSLASLATCFLIAVYVIFPEEDEKEEVKNDKKEKK